MIARRSARLASPSEVMSEDGGKTLDVKERAGNTHKQPVDRENFDPCLSRGHAITDPLHRPEMARTFEQVSLMILDV
jgi:hypothetical protein